MEVKIKRTLSSSLHASNSKIQKPSKSSRKSTVPNAWGSATDHRAITQSTWYLTSWKGKTKSKLFPLLRGHKKTKLEWLSHSFQSLKVIGFPLLNKSMKTWYQFFLHLIQFYPSLIWQNCNSITFWPSFEEIYWKISQNLLENKEKWSFGAGNGRIFEKNKITIFWRFHIFIFSFSTL